MQKPKIDPTWYEKLHEEFDAPYMSELKQFLEQEKELYSVYPKGSLIFNAYNTTPFNCVKVVILGQDPYHGHDQAHGLSFSVRHGIANPPSLQNIFKELSSDIGCHHQSSGDLTPWAEQGVFLLNATLTVRANEAHSHKDKGWERFTDATIRTISTHKEGVVFILWGSHAQKKVSLIDQSRHCIITSPHPSPLSAYRGFFGSKPFSRTNAYLAGKNQTPIQWCF